MEKIILIDTNILALDKGKELSNKLINNITISPFHETIKELKKELKEKRKYFNEKERTGKIKIIPEINDQNKGFIDGIINSIKDAKRIYIAKLNSPWVIKDNYQEQKEFLLYERDLIKYKKTIEEQIAFPEYNLGNETLFDLVSGIEQIYKTTKENHKFDFNTDKKLVTKAIYETIINKNKVEIISNDKDIYEVLNYTKAFLDKNICQIINYEPIEFFLNNTPKIITYRETEETELEYTNPINQIVKGEELNLYEKQKRLEFNSFSKIVCGNLDNMIEQYRMYQKVMNKSENYHEKRRNLTNNIKDQKRNYVGFEYPGMNK